MFSRTIKQLFAAASFGSLILVSALPANAGRMFKEEPSRPHTFAGCQPAWGYNQTCWQRFPALPPCDSNGSCYGQTSEGATSYDHSRGVYPPQNTGAMVDPGFSTVPYSLMPGQNSTRIIVPNDGTTNAPPQFQYGSPSNIPSVQAPLQEYSAPPQTLQSSEPSVDHPAQQIPPVPAGTLSLPPLPAPPEALPAAPGQTHFQPQHEQLMIGADGRLTTATAMHRNQQYRSSASRYGQIKRPVASEQFPSSSLQRRTGPPLHFANAITDSETQPTQRRMQPAGTASDSNGYSARTLARPVSQTHNALPANSSRYGMSRPAVSLPMASSIIVEPLRSTPENYR